MICNLFLKYLYIVKQEVDDKKVICQLRTYLLGLTKFQRAKITRNVWHTIKRTDDKITSIEK